MLKRTLPAMMYLTLFILAGCSSDDDASEPEDETNFCLLSEMNITSTDEESTSRSLLFEYADDKLTQLTISSEEVEDGVTYAGTEVFEASYDDDLMTSISYYYDEEKSWDYTVTYTNSDFLSQIEGTGYDNEGEEAYFQEFRFTYSGDRVTEVYFALGYIEDGEFDYYAEATEYLTYSENNVVKIEGEDELSVYDFDEHSNPLNENLLWFLWDRDLAFFLSENNITGLDYYEDDALSSSEELTYQYDAEGSPLIVTFPDDEGNTYSMNFAYDCD